jgi:hypothetical protein
MLVIIQFISCSEWHEDSTDVKQIMPPGIQEFLPTNGGLAQVCIRRHGNMPETAFAAVPAPTHQFPQEMHCLAPQPGQNGPVTNSPQRQQNEMSFPVGLAVSCCALGFSPATSALSVLMSFGLVLSVAI